MRTVLRNRDEVAHFWANRVQHEGRSGNVFFVGPIIYSYGTHFAIAKHFDQGVAFSNRDYSPSTSSHKSLVRRAIPAGTKVIYVPCPNQTAHDQLRMVQRDIDGLLDRASRARQNKATLMAVALRKAEDFNTFAEWQYESCRISVAQDLATFRAEMAEAERVAQERAAKRAAEEEARNAEGIAEWLAGTRVVCPRTASPKLRVKAPRGDRLTDGADGPSLANESVIETSWGADIPVEDAKRLWPIIQRQRREGLTHDFGGRFKVGHYRLQTIRSDGSIVVGCHDIAYTEIERIAVQLGLIEKVAA